MMIPIVLLHFMDVCKNHAVGLNNVHTFYLKVIIQLGSVFPHISAAYLHRLCAIVERDGSDLMFLFVARWYVFGFGWAC